jgi:hypothetical protein
MEKTQFAEQTHYDSLSALFFDVEKRLLDIENSFLDMQKTHFDIENSFYDIQKGDWDFPKTLKASQRQPVMIFLRIFIFLCWPKSY